MISISRKPPFKEWLKEMRDIPGSGIKDEDIAKMSKDGGSSGRLHWVCSDLLVDSMDEVANKLEAVGGDKITHVFYAGYVVIDGWMGKKERAANAKLFDVGVGAAAKIAAKSLRRICVQTGAKAYGFHVQHTKCPLTEADPWHPVGADFYIDQVESAKRLSEASGGQFDWVVTVPSGIWGFSRSSFMNSATTWALYCAVQAHRGVELSFNGSIERWLVGNDFVDAMHLAKFDVWCGTTAKCGGEYFNASNGSVYTWEWMWPIFCEYFGAKMPELDPETMAPKRIVSVQKEMTGMVLPTPASTTQLDVDLSTAKESDAVGTPNHVAVNAWKEMCEKYPNMDPDAINWATWW